VFLFGTVILATVLPHCNVTLNMAAITLTNATTTLEPKNDGVILFEASMRG
jgi:hypothetical protein